MLHVDYTSIKKKIIPQHIPGDADLAVLKNKCYFCKPSLTPEIKFRELPDDGFAELCINSTVIFIILFFNHLSIYVTF